MAKRSVGMVLAEYLDNQKKRERKDDIETVMNLVEFLLLNQTIPNSIISTTSNDLSNWSRLSSLWPLLYGTSCCFIEFASLIGSRFDFDRYGLVPRSSPRQADLMLTAGTVTMKKAPYLVRLFDMSKCLNQSHCYGSLYYYRIQEGCSVLILIVLFAESIS
uniref:NADH-plastoquinone oxidoreductase subunit K n=1 Tax=Epidendrum avicula TaxID=123163 RepID=A0AA96MPA6_9ASPA|nr:NADH-plastoquinone oxidoreductase subunit K [Epidendrum avicula]WNS59759.1 NADH-plastoquinone oxidoreductase subunit K [Epidendrum avicula]